MARIHAISPAPVSPISDQTGTAACCIDTALSLPRLEAELTELWGHINAATCRFLALLAEFDRREGWAAHGLAGAAQWLNWQCGIGEVAAREKVRVARALEELPAVSAAFARGELSYSKVRALTRVATPANEALLLDIALHGTAAHVEKLVRKYRRVQQAEDATHANAQHRARLVEYYHDDDGCMVLHARLPAEIGAVVRLAIERALDELAADGLAEQRSGPAESKPGSADQTHSNVSAESPAGAPTKHFTRPAEPADSDAADTPLAARRADALKFIAERFLASALPATGSAADRYQVIVHVDQRSLAGVGAGAGVGAAPAGAHARATGIDTVTAELDGGRMLALATVRRLACDAALVGLVETARGEPLSVGRRTRSIPPALRRALAVRDGGCRFPGCARTRYTEGHHVLHWARGGETKLANLVTLCGFHHRLVHEGGFGVHVVHDGSAREMFVFTRPDGTRVPPVGARPKALSPAATSLPAGHRALGLRIDASTARSRWLGEPLDYGLAIDALRAAEGGAAEGARCRDGAVARMHGL